MSTKSLLPVAASAVLLAVAGCTSMDRAGTSPTAPAAKSSTSVQESAQPAPTGERTEAAAVVIEIKDFEFAAGENVPPGATVSVHNNDMSTHSVTSEGGEFTEVVVEGGGATGTVTAPKARGEYPYICRFHPEMAGTLVVE